MSGHMQQSSTAHRPLFRQQVRRITLAGCLTLIAVATASPEPQAAAAEPSLRYDFFQTAQRSWQDATGERFVSAALLWADGEELRFLTSDGRITSASRAQLSPADRQQIDQHPPTARWRTWSLQTPAATALSAILLKSSAADIELLDHTGARHVLKRDELSRPDHLFVTQQEASLRPTENLILPAPADSAKALSAAAPSHAPFLRMYITEHFLAELLGSEIHRNTTVRDNILGADVRGSGITRGQLSVRTLPSEQGVLVDLMLHGVATTNTISTSGPARIYNQNITRFAAIKQLRMADMKIAAGPALANAVTQSRTTNIDTGGGLFGGLIQRIAWRRVDESRTQAEQIASTRNALRISRTLDQEVEKRLEKLRARLAQSMLASLHRNKTIQLRTSSGPGYVLIEATGPLPGGLGELPPLTDRDEIAMQVHMPQLTDLLRTQSNLVELITDDVLDAATDLEQLKPIAEQVVAKLLNNATNQSPEYAVRLTKHDDWALIRARRYGSLPGVTPAQPAAQPPAISVAKRIRPTP